MLVVLAGSPAIAAEPTEVELVRGVLSGSVSRAELEAAALQRRASAVGPGVLADPTVGARHEQANGPAGASTDIVAGSVTFDGLGLERAVATGAAGIRHRAGPHWQEARNLDAVCAIRSEIADLDAALRALVATRDGQARLDELFATLSGLTEAGEASGYDRDLSALARTQHHLEHIDAESRAAEIRAWFEARSGVTVDGVVLDGVEAPASASGHPELVALKLEVRAAERAASSADLGALPDITLEGGARWDAMPDGTQRAGGYEVGAGLTLPLFDRNRQAIQSARYEAAAARATLERRRAELAARSASAEARIAMLSPMSGTPEPEPLWQAARVRYDAGETSLEELLQAAERVEAATLAEIERARLLRHAQLDRACAAGSLPAPFDELVRESR